MDLKLGGKIKKQVNLSFQPSCSYSSIAVNESSLHAIESDPKGTSSSICASTSLINHTDARKTICSPGVFRVDFPSDAIEINANNNDDNIMNLKDYFDVSAYEKDLSELNLNKVADNYENIQRFFSEQRRIACAIPIDEIEMKPSTIISILRPYQSETIRWMIMRETKQQQLQLGKWGITLPSGGILADEMGLGKTVELLACILNHSKKQIDVTKEPNKLCQPPAALLGKRSLNENLEVPFMKKKPRLSTIRQNPTLKTEIWKLLEEYFEKFNRDLLRKHEALNENCKAVISSCFKVLLLYRYYNNVTKMYPKHQTWGYLVSEFNITDSDSIGYSILLKETQKNGEKLPPNMNLSEEVASKIVTLVNNFMNEKRTKAFQKDLYRGMRFCLNVSAGEFIPLREGDDVKCSCGSDRAKGKKIKCSKCNFSQHLKCIGLDQLPEDTDTYCCPNCWVNEPQVESAGTLIVVPSILVYQWADEIKKYAADCDLKVYWYKGVKNGYTLPPVLASYDIVLTTFETLRNELSFVKITESRPLRGFKRYQWFVTPLTCIHWWRLCVDEAQIVESNNRVSEMAALIKTDHLWAVTGTPVGKSLHDLYGLTTYLRMKPFILSDVYWNVLLSRDQSLLHRLFAYLMRRKTKEEVNDQLNLPELTVNIQWLSFPPTEGYFYNRTYEQLRDVFLRKILAVENLDQQLKKANRQTVEKVLAPLFVLREASVNPRTVNQKNHETMQDLLKKMIKKTKVECEDALRLYIMNINGIASLQNIAENYVDAVSWYRKVLSKTKTYVDLKPDDFQMIHVMHNLYKTAMKDSIIALTEEEAAFPEKIANVEKKCLEKKQEEIDTVMQQLSKYTSEIINCIGKYELKQFSWWQNMLNTFDFNELTTRIVEDLKNANIKLTGILKLKLVSRTRLNEAVKFWLSNMESKRDLTFSFLDKISKETTTEALWNAANNCHLRKPQPARSCLLCRMEDLMSKYESLLFNADDRVNANKTVVSEPGKTNPIDWKHSAYECVLNVLLTCSRSAFGSTIDNINAGNQLKALGLLKREFKAIRAVWTRHCDLINVYDEILMAKSTSDQFINAEEIKNPDVQMNIYLEQSSDTNGKLQSKYGSLQYLKNLEIRYKNSRIEEEACPVCQTSMDEKRAVMTCGHFTCYGCMQELILHHKIPFSNGLFNNIHNKIPCPICRSLSSMTTITYVYGGGTSNFDASDVRGCYSIKIVAVTAKVLTLIKADPKVKILVFSTWERTLRVIERAFKENGISYRKFAMNSLATFKGKDNVTVLLMPVHSGSRGLNLTEASHIIFTEPLLNFADEKQAVGRIYRLGQSKNMTVHKFIIKSTVEEHIHKMTAELQRSNVKCELTFRHVYNLFEASSNLPLVSNVNRCSC